MLNSLKARDDLSSKEHTIFMPFFENSPVLAALGMVRSGSARAVGAAPDPAALQAYPGGLEQLRLALGGGAPAASAAGWQPEVATAAPAEQVAVRGPPPAAVPFAGKQLRADAARRYEQGMQTPNRYGYLPMANEWDVWVSPSNPASLTHATISHGSPLALIKQAVLSGVPCLRPFARSAGNAHISKEGLSPAKWLTQFGHAINAAVAGAADVPLPLHGPEEHWNRLRLRVVRLEGVRADAWARMYVVAGVEAPTVALPTCRCGEVAWGGTVSARSL